MSEANVAIRCAVPGCTVEATDRLLYCVTATARMASLAKRHEEDLCKRHATMYRGACQELPRCELQPLRKVA